MKIVVCGSRDFADPFRTSLAIEARIAQIPVDSLVIHGGARGADQIAAAAAGRRGAALLEFPAKWKNLGKQAGVIRNLEMLAQQPDLVIAFYNGESRGTAHMINEARRRGFETEVIPL